MYGKQPTLSADDWNIDQIISSSKRNDKIMSTNDEGKGSPCS